MKLGEEFKVRNDQLVEALKGRVADMEVDGTPVRVRITDTGTILSTVKVVKPDTKE